MIKQTHPRRWRLGFTGFAVVLLMAAAYASAVPSLTRDSLDVPPDSLSAGIVSVADSTAIDEPANRFVLKCGGCHTVGGGKRTGPDLLPTRVWPMPDLLAKIELMENRVGPLSAGELQQYADFLKSDRVQERIKLAQDLAGKAVALKLAPASAKIGRELFEGKRPLAARGLACIACHRVGPDGGTVGPNLTHIRLKTPKIALVSAIQQAQYTLMTGTYLKHPIMPQEAVHLAEYLDSPAEHPTTGSDSAVSPAGVVAALAGLAGVVVAYRRRHSRTAYLNRRNR